MKTLNRILRIALASTLALSQGAWFPALAASHGKHQAVVAIGTDELKSEYGAGGGGGGTDPTPVDSSGPKWTWDSSLWVQESATTGDVLRISTEILFEQTNDSAADPAPYLYPYDTQCSVTFSGDASLGTGNSGIKVSGTESCSTRLNVTIDLAPYTKGKLFRGNNAQYTTQKYQKYDRYMDLRSPQEMRNYKNVGTGIYGSRQKYQTWISMTWTTSASR